MSAEINKGEGERFGFHTLTQLFLLPFGCEAKWIEVCVCVCVRALCYGTATTKQKQKRERLGDIKLQKKRKIL